jgi:3-hydroxyisobutyrate dehydrogenase-like beta-hydroxyacid dehydrogenase
MRNLRKDLKAAVEAAQDMSVPTAMGDATLPLFNKGVDDAGWGADDYSAISRFAQDAANVTIATGKPRKG